MTKQDIKHALISLLVGALITFISHLFDGILILLKSWGAGIVGGAGASITYLFKHYTA